MSRSTVQARQMRKAVSKLAKQEQRPVTSVAIKKGGGGHKLDKKKAHVLTSDGLRFRKKAPILIGFLVNIEKRSQIQVVDQFKKDHILGWDPTEQRQTSEVPKGAKVKTVDRRWELLRELLCSPNLMTFI